LGKKDRTTYSQDLKLGLLGVFSKIKCAVERLIMNEGDDSHVWLSPEWKGAGPARPQAPVEGEKAKIKK